jgi:hypothetical protein
VITHSVGTAGVLLVFVFLVVPAIVSIIITDTLWKQLIIGWGLGVVVSILGLYISYVADLPSGPTVVSFYGIVLAIVAIVIYILKAERRNWALIKVAFGIAITIIIIAGFYMMGKSFQSQFHEHDHSDYLSEEEHILHEVQEHQLLENMSEEELLAFLEDYRNVEKLHLLFDAEKDSYIRFKIAKRMIQLDKKSGLILMFDLLKICDLPFLQEEIIQQLRNLTNQNFGFDANNSENTNKRALKEWEEYLKN